LHGGHTPPPGVVIAHRHSPPVQAHRIPSTRPGVPVQAHIVVSESVQRAPSTSQLPLGTASIEKEPPV